MDFVSSISTEIGLDKIASQLIMSHTTHYATHFQDIDLIDDMVDRFVGW